jgi:hypothetical protein
MKKLFYSVAQNEYFSNESHSTLVSDFSLIADDVRLKINDITYAAILLGYPKDGWKNNVDIFQYFDSTVIDRLQNNNTVLLCDYTFEGFSQLSQPVAKVLRYNCEIYNINPDRIFLFTGNLADDSSYINVIPLYLLDNERNFRQPGQDIEDLTLDWSKNQCKELLGENIFLSLSRRNRFHRVVGHTILLNSSIAKEGLISQDRLDDFYFNPYLIKEMGLSEEQINNFKKTLPSIADADMFQINQPFNPLTKLHLSTVFSIVNETLTDDVQGTSLFFSEKILKPVINYQPMIIYGQPGINHELTQLGYKTYEGYFDLDFDYEPNHVLRYRKLLDSITKTVNKLKSMSKEERIDWRYQCHDILEYNFKNFVNRTHGKQQMAVFADKLVRLFCNN